MKKPSDNPADLFKKAVAFFVAVISVTCLVFNGQAHATNEDDPLRICTAYVMADYHFFDQNKGDADMDLYFEDAVLAFTDAALKSYELDSDDYGSRLWFHESVIPVMLPIYMSMEQQKDASGTDPKLDSLRSFCINVGAQHEQTQGILE